MYIEQWTYYRVREQSVVTMAVQNYLLSDSVSMYIEQWTYYRVREQSVCNNAHSEFTYSLKEPNLVSMYIEQWTYYRVREQSVCNNAHSDDVQNNLLSERIKFSIHVHREVDILQGKRTISV